MIRRLAALALLVATSLAPAQTLTVAPRRDGARVVLDVRAQGATALDVMVALAAAARRPLKTDAEALKALAAATVDFDRSGVSYEEGALLVALRAGVEARLGADETELRGFAQNDSEALVRRRDVALAHLGFSLTARPDADRAPDLENARGALRLSGGDYLGALQSYQAIDRGKRGPDFAQEMLLFAAEAALRAGRIPDAEKAVEAFESSPTDLPATPGAELVGARIHAAAGRLREAGFRLRHAVRHARYPRDRALASLLLAEAAWTRRDGKAMLDALDLFPADARRAFPDLARRVPFITGLALLAADEPLEALTYLRLALHEDLDAGRRCRSARLVAETLRRVGRPVEALVAVRQAEALAPDVPSRRRAAALRAELEMETGLRAAAFATALRELAECDAPSADADRLLVVAATAAAAGDRPSDAEAALDAMDRRPALRGRAAVLRASLERRAGRPEAALRALNALTPDEAATCGLPPTELRRLKGELALAAGDALGAAEAFAAPAPAPESRESR
ncbi:MAG TPA: hypothetical protein VEI02_11755 [Planctomycetota bacterium]|nr:hypothetical protein [Planctomycetota bacterium]